MSGQITYPRQVLRLVSDRKKRKLAADVSDDTSSFDSHDGSYLSFNSSINLIENSQSSSLEGQRDLFGELIPISPKCSNNTPKPKSKSSSKKPVSKTKKPPLEYYLTSNSVSTPKRVFIPTPKFIEVMKEAQTELYSLMGINKSSTDVSTASSNSFNVSGVQQLLDVNESNAQAESIVQPEIQPTTNPINAENTDQNSALLKGVFAFVDYKVDNERRSYGFNEYLTNLGAKVEKTFNNKVTHVIFRDGYPKTYKKATEHNIPLVSARWVEKSRLANKMLDPADYPPIGIEKYAKEPKINLNIPKRLNKFFRQSDIDRDNLFRSKCNDILNHINTLKLNTIDENKENSITKTPKNQNSMESLNCHHKTNDIISLLADNLFQVLNTSDSSILNEDELYIPMSIKMVKKYLTPKGSENKTPDELNDELLKIEDRLQLNSQARKRFRKLLFPSEEKNLNESSIVSDFPSPSPEKLRISAPARLTSTKKQKVLDTKEKLHHNKNLNDKEKTPEKKHVQNKEFQWQIPSDLRPKKSKKINIQKNNTAKVTRTQESYLSRDSSIIFQTPKESLISPVIQQTIACTGMNKNEKNIIKLCIETLGTFIFHKNVERTTMYLVTKTKPNRTLSMVFAMAYGCYIVSEDWVHESHKIGRWLSHQQYLIPDLSDPVKKFQIQRNTFGSSLMFYIFEDVGSIYISNNCDPSSQQLKRLVRACGGKCTSNETTANVIVGHTSKMNDNVHEKWILDCITQGKLLNQYEYTIVRK